MTTPADRIAETLRMRGPLTAADIAAEHGCGVVAVRSQLRNLEAAGLVARVTERRPIGRPVSRYSLTPGAESLFPKRYDLFSVRLAEAVVREFGEEGLSRILARWEDDLHQHLDATLPQNPSQRLEALASHQTRNGFMASVQSDENGVALVERNCPIVEVAARFPQICRHEAALFGRTLKWKTTLQSCQATGDAVCVFQIGRAAKKAAGTPPSPEKR
jgi:predicted ArsR family transcriptional regulator